MSQPARVLVLGGGGFVGGAIMRALAATGAMAPVAAQRRPPRHDPHGPAASFRRCDVNDPAALAAALHGMDAAVNAVLGDRATMLAAARALAQAQAQGRLSRVVHLSSIAVYGPAAGLIAEDAPRAAGASRYGQAKIACEAAAGPGSVILRPGIVYGPGGEQWIGRLCRALRARRLGDLGPAGEGLCNLVHADDVAAAVVACLRLPTLAGQAINLATPEPPTWNAVLAILAGALGLPVRRIPKLRLVLERHLFAPPLALARRALGGARASVLPEPLPPSLFALFAQPVRFSSRKADRLLALPRTDDRAGLLGAAAWFREAHPGP